MNTIQWLSEHDMARWDAFVAQHPLGWLCHLSGWKRVIEKSFSHITGNIAAVVDDAGAIQAGLPVYEVKSLLTGNRLVCAPFATLFDPLVSTPEHAILLGQALCERVVKTGADRAELRTLRSTDLCALPDFAPSCGYKLHELELTGVPEDIMRRFSYSSVRQNIRRAAKIPLRSYLAQTPEHLAEFYELFLANRRRLGLPAIPLKFFQALQDEFAGCGQAIFMLAAWGATPVAGLVGLRFNRRLSLEYLGWDSTFKRVTPSPFILWEAIKLACESGCTVFDFGRTAAGNTGLLEYKRKWGTREIDLVEYTYPDRAEGSGAFKRENALGYALARYASRMAPGPAYRLISSFCYHHLG